MNLTPIDWTIIVVYLACCTAAGVWMRRYVRSVEDFAVAGRKMDLNLGVASLAATEVGIVTVMYTAQMGFTDGLAGATFGVLGCLAMILIGCTGFVIVPLRNANVITIPELFEKRFGKHVRWLAGLVVILGGVLNMGVFLSIGGKFLMFVAGLDPKAAFHLSLLGCSFSLGYLELMMTALLAVVLIYTVLGGMISVLITDYLQFLVMGLGIVVTSVLVVWTVGWPNLLAELPKAHEVKVAYQEASEAAAEALAVAQKVAPEKEEKPGHSREISEADAGQKVPMAEVARKSMVATDVAREAASGTEPEAKAAAEIARERAAELAAARVASANDAMTAAAETNRAAEAVRKADEEAAAATKNAERAATAAMRAAARAEIAEQVAKASSAAPGDDPKTLAARQEAEELGKLADDARRAADEQAERVKAAAAAARAAAGKAEKAAQNVQSVSGGLAMGHPFNPFSRSGKGLGWVLWQALTAIAVSTTWQTTIARVLAARNAATAKAIYRRTSFYYVGRFGLPGVWGIGAFLYFWRVGGLPEGIDNLTAMPVFLHTVLPVGVLGLVIAAMLAAEMSTDSGYLLTWATVIYNDLIGPCLRKPLSTRGKLLTVRLLVLAIGLFLVVYGLWYEIPGGAWDYLVITGNIYLASLFSLLVGALYWRGANSWGAVSAIFLGAIGPLTFLVVNGIVEKEHQISPTAAGLSAFGLAFGGMIVGSMIGRVMGAADGHDLQGSSGESN